MSAHSELVLTCADNFWFILKTCSVKNCNVVVLNLHYVDYNYLFYSSFWNNESSLENISFCLKKYSSDDENYPIWRKPCLHF